MACKRRFVSILLLAWTAVQCAQAKVLVYGDIRATDSNPAGTPLFATFDALIAEPIGRDDTLLVEAVYSKSDHDTHVSLERWWWRHRLSDVSAVAFGRFHNALGHWNRAKHHGTLLQDTVDRPRFLEFEDEHNAGFLPMHFVGLSFEQLWYVDQGQLSLLLNWGNGQKLTGVDHEASYKPQQGEFFADNHMATARLEYKASSRDLELSLFANSQTVIASDDYASWKQLNLSDRELLEQEIWGLAALKTLGSWDAKFEWFDIPQRLLFDGGNDLDATAWYFQLGYRLNHDWKLIARVEDLEFSDSEQAEGLFHLQSYDRQLLALRYDLNSDTALKLQFSRGGDLRHHGEENLWQVQLSFRIPN